MRLMIFVVAVAALSGGLFAQDIVVSATPSSTPSGQVPTANPLSTPTPALPQRLGNRGAMMQACQADFAALCAGMTPGDGKLGPCIRTNRDKLSPSCQAAMREAMGARGGLRVPPAATPTP